MILLYSSAIECLLIAPCIGIVLRECSGEVVIAREILFGTHIYIVVLGWIEYTLYACYAGYAYGAWRQSCILVCIVWGVYGEVSEEYAA